MVISSLSPRHLARTACAALLACACACGAGGSEEERCTTEAPLDPIAARVQVRVSTSDDLVYLNVNGLRHEVRPSYGVPGEAIDATSWFVDGENEARVQVVGRGPAWYRVELWADGACLLDEGCDGEDCAAVAGVSLDRKLRVSLQGLPAAQRLELTSAEPGQLYVDGQFMGRRTPTSILVPPGRYTLGLGQGDETPGAYTGRFFETEVTVGDAPQTVALDARAPLGLANLTRVAVLPVRRTVHGEPGDVGVLADTDIAYFVGQAQATSEAWVRPFSYGLTGWEVTALPVVEDVVLQRDASCMSAPNTGLLLAEAGLEPLRDQYDIIVFLYSSHRADGSEVSHVPCAIWAAGPEVSYHSSWLRSIPVGLPSEGLYHETLHSYDDAAWWRGSYSGVGGVHGAEEHGYHAYQNGEGEWLAWYRALARGQVAELASMRDGVAWRTIPGRADLYVGLFEVMRHGMDDAWAASSRGRGPSR